MSVVTTEQGLPTAIKIDPRELKRAPQDLAQEILALCRLSAMRAQVAHRRELVEQGYGPEIVNAMKLANEQQLADVEEQLAGDDELPTSWMRSV